MIQNGAWSRIYPQIEIFDDQFVDENVCSGLDVAPGHRQNLHELILGAQGVTLHTRVNTAVESVESVNARIRNASSAIPLADRHGLTVEEFCNLPERGDIEDAVGRGKLFAQRRFSNRSDSLRSMQRELRLSSGAICKR